MADRKWNNPVRSQMGGTIPSTTASCARPMDAPFGKPHDVGNGGIPLKLMEDLGPNERVGRSVTPAERGGLATVPASGPSRSPERAAPPSNKK